MCFLEYYNLLQGDLSMNKKSRYKSLDILRGLAIIMVLMTHLDPKFITAIEELSGMQGFIFWRLHTAGWAGGDLFFILSGFLISTILLKKWTEKELFSASASG